MSLGESTGAWLRRVRFFRGRWLGLAVVWLILFAYVVFPALSTFAGSFRLADGSLSLAAYAEFFSVRPIESLSAFFQSWSWSTGNRFLSPGIQALYGSFTASVLSVILAALIGIPLAFFAERNAFPGRGAFAGLMLLPLMLPPIVGVVSFELIFSEAGVIPRGIQSLFGMAEVPFYLEGRPAVIAVHAYSFFPFFFLLVSGALRDTDASLIEASRSLGANGFRTLLRVQAPILLPALLGASVMVFMLSMASFSAPLLFDVEGMYLSTYIYNLKTQDLWSQAYVATSVFAGSSLAMLVVLRWLRGSKRYQSLGKGVPRRRSRASSAVVRSLTAGFAGLILFIVLMPHLGIFLWSMTRDGTWTYQVLPPEYTLDNYSRVLGFTGDAQILRPVVNSFWMAGLATAVNIVFGIAAAYSLKGRGVPGKTVTDLLVMLPWALPGTVIAINLIVSFNHPTPLALGANLANTVWLLPMAYFIRNIPLIVRPLAAAWERVGDDVEEAARSLGSGRLRMLRTVSLPLLRPALISGGLLAFVTALGEFIASAILYTPDNKPISMAIFGEFHSGAYALCAAYGIVLILLIGVVMVIGGRSSQGPAV